MPSALFYPDSDSMCDSNAISYNTYTPDVSNLSSNCFYHPSSFYYANLNRDVKDNWETASVNSFTPDDYVHHSVHPVHSVPGTHRECWLPAYLSPSLINGCPSSTTSGLSGPFPARAQYISVGPMTQPNFENQDFLPAPLSPPRLQYLFPPGGVDHSSSSSFSPENCLITSPRDSQVVTSSRSYKTTSLLLAHLLRFGQPSYFTSMSEDFYPFSDVSVIAQDSLAYPVVKLTNIPFGVSRNEIASFLGCHHRLPDAYEPIHIMMCRSTGKTMEVFIELETEQDLDTICENYEECQRSNRPPKIGNRAVTVAKSSQSELMRHMFPTVGGIEWIGCRPVFKPISQNQARARRTFRGFISEEEVTMAIRHVEYPQKSPFSRSCPERAFEYLISTLRKYPWRYTSFITIGERYNLFRLTFQLTDFLQERVFGGTNHYPGRISPTLFHRVVDTALSCPGFTPFMKANLAELVKLPEDQMHHYGIPPRGNEWRHQYGIVPRPGIPPDVLMWYIDTIHDWTLQNQTKLPVSILASLSITPILQPRNNSRKHCPCWGLFWKFFPRRLSSEDLNNMTLEDVIQEEYAAVRYILSRALNSV